MFNLYGERKDTGLMSIEDARELYDQFYYNDRGSSLLMKIELKAWIGHSESRHKNGNSPFSFTNYTNHMSYRDYADQVSYNMIDCSDLGGKEYVLFYLNTLMGK